MELFSKRTRGESCSLVMDGRVNEFEFFKIDWDFETIRGQMVCEESEQLLSGFRHDKNGALGEWPRLELANDHIASECNNWQP